MIPIPRNKPQASLSVVMDSAKQEWNKFNEEDLFPETFVLAVRGYFSKTIGEVGNDINVYDDAHFIVSPLGISAWNSNVDPTRYGWNAKAGKYMARLSVGCWKFQSLIHRGKYQAFGQGDNLVKVDRVRADESVARVETGLFGINDHLGGVNGTSSEGCMTHPPQQWNGYRKKLNEVLALASLKQFDFILVEGPIN